MKIEVNIEKKYAIFIIVGVLILAGVIVAYAYGTSNPSVFGHSFEELQGVQHDIDSTQCPMGKGIVKINDNGEIVCDQAFLQKDISYYETTGNTNTQNGGNGQSISKHDFCFSLGMKGSLATGTVTCRVFKGSDNNWYILAYNDQPTNFKCYVGCTN